MTVGSIWDTFVRQPGAIATKPRPSCCSLSSADALSTTTKTRREKALMTEIGPAYGQALRASLPGLIAELDAELAALDAVGDPEPELIGPTPDGPLSGLQPLVIVD